MFHSVAKRGAQQQWQPKEFESFEKMEGYFKVFESVLLHTLGHQTQFQSTDPILFLKRLPELSKPFFFVRVPEQYTQFADLYDVIWQKPGLFMIIAPDSACAQVHHLGEKKTWKDSKGVEWSCLRNYQQAMA